MLNLIKTQPNHTFDLKRESKLSIFIVDISFIVAIPKQWT